MMTFRESLDYLYSANIFGSRPGLTRVRELLDRLGNPQKNVRVLHIAGTNGKGSVSSYCAHIAAAMNLRCGWFTSPYLETFNERIRIIDGRRGLEEFKRDFRSPEISNEVFAAMMTELREQIELMIKDGYDMPTVFEMETAAAFLWFSKAKVDLVVLEVGMGGRLDSTNIVDEAMCSVITALSYDHMDRLGSTLGEIAFEKAGIIKRGCPVVVYNPYDAVQDAAEAESALQVIKKTAAEKQAPMTLVSRSEISDLQETDEGQSFRLAGSDRVWHIQLLGRYQAMNAALAIKACRCFADEDTIAEGLAKAVWPGRLELMRKNPPLMIDGAHNIQGCEELSVELASRFAGRSLIFLCGMLGDKEHQKMLNAVLNTPGCQAHTVICTIPPVPRGLSGEELAKEAAQTLGLGREDVQPLPENPAGLSETSPITYNKSKVYWHDRQEEALEAALQLSEQNGLPLVAFGSLYLIGNLRPVIRERLKQEAGEQSRNV